MSAAPTNTPAPPAVTAQDLELEHAELLPARETLWVPRAYPRPFPWGPLYPNPGSYPPVGHYWESPARLG